MYRKTMNKSTANKLHKSVIANIPAKIITDMRPPKFTPSDQCLEGEVSSRSILTTMTCATAAALSIKASYWWRQVIPAVSGGIFEAPPECHSSVFGYRQRICCIACVSIIFILPPTEFRIYILGLLCEYDTKQQACQM